MEIEKHIIVDTEPASFFKEYLDQGFTGMCYKTEDGKVYKQLHNDLIDVGLLRYLSHIKMDNFAFPETLVYQYERKKENILGYLMPFMEGPSIKDIDPNINMLDLIESIERAEMNIYELSKYGGVQMDDVNPSNVIFSPDKEIKFIDTDLYDYFPSEEEYEIFKLNIKEFGNLIMCLYADGFPFTNDRINEMWYKCVRNGRARPSIILYELYNELQNNFDKVNTMGEFKKGIELLKRQR